MPMSFTMWRHMAVKKIKLLQKEHPHIQVDEMMMKFS